MSGTAQPNNQSNPQASVGLSSVGSPSTATSVSPVHSTPNTPTSSTINTPVSPVTNVSGTSSASTPINSNNLEGNIASPVTQNSQAQHRVSPAPPPQEQTKQQVSADDPQGEKPKKKIQTIERPKDGSELNIVELINYVVKQAIKAKTSDVHIEPHEEIVVVRFRIDGILKDVLQIGKDVQESLLFRIKVAAKLRTDEHFAPQDGRIRFVIDNKKIDTRISILPTSAGEKVVMRLLIKEGKSFSFTSLGMSEHDQLIVEKSYNRPYGMILAVGPTGSGKTTSLYAILQKLNSRDVNITTVEDPVEYSIDGVNHIQVNNKANLTFASGLRSILRQDPDIIMIGEIRDAETANIATNAALTGHLVLSSLHTNDAISTIPRLTDMEVEPFLVASTLNIIIAQRLARKLCDNCKKEYTITEEKYSRIKKMRPDLAEMLKVGDKIFEEGGCDTCGESGFSGRVGLFEILEITEKIRRMISERENIDIIFQVAKENEMKTIVEDGVNAVKNGITSIEEIMRVTALKQ